MLDPAFGLALSLLTALAACGDGEPEPSSKALAQNQTASLSAYGGLARGQPEILVEGITAAENALFLADGRLLVSGDEGLYELTRDDSGRVTAQNLRPGEACKFGGIAELSEAVYAVCYDNVRSTLFASLKQPLSFRAIAPIEGVSLANGAVGDGANHVYVSATGQGKIVRLTVSTDDPLRVSQQEVWRSNTGGLLPNGLDYHDGTLYWGDFGSIRRLYASSTASTRVPAALVAQLTFFDDLHVDAQGLLVADFLFDKVRAYDRDGRRISETPSCLSGPSSVLPARGRLGLGERDLVVTEKSASRVSVFRPRS